MGNAEHFPYLDARLLRTPASATAGALGSVLYAADHSERPGVE